MNTCIVILQVLKAVAKKADWNKADSQERNLLSSFCRQYDVSEESVCLLCGIGHSLNYTDQEWVTVLSLLNKLIGKDYLSESEAAECINVSESEFTNLMLTYISFPEWMKEEPKQ